MKHGRIFWLFLLLIAAPKSLAGGVGAFTYALSPPNGATVPSNSKVWTMLDIESSWEADRFPTVNQCKDPTGELADCIGPLVSLSIVDDANGSIYFTQRLYEGSPTLSGVDAAGFWLIGEGSYGQGTLWEVTEEEDIDPPAAPVFLSGEVTYDVRFNNSGENEIPEVEFHVGTRWKLPADDYGIAFIELQTAAGEVRRRRFVTTGSEFYIWESSGAKGGSYRAIAVDYAGNRSPPSIVGVVEELDFDPHVEFCRTHFLPWCSQILPSDDGGVHSAEDGGSASDGAQVNFDGGGRVSGPVCSCSADANRRLPAQTVALIFFAALMRRTCRTCREST